jgi:hypothetical protein
MAAVIYNSSGHPAQLSKLAADHKKNSVILKIKGTVQRDFLIPVFFTKRLILVSIDMPQSDFEIFRILTELFVLKL